jgi:hypothetical protein
VGIADHVFATPTSATALFNLVYHSDDLRVATSPTLVRIDDDGITAYPPSSLTFINSGTRPIAVLAMTRILVQWDGSNDDVNCHSRAGAYFIGPFEHLVVKPNDTVTHKPFDKPNAVHRPLSRTNEELLDPTSRRAMFCVMFELVATDTSRWIKTIEIERTGIGATRDLTPAYLIKRNTFWTTVGRDEY